MRKQYDFSAGIRRRVLGGRPRSKRVRLRGADTRQPHEDPGEDRLTEPQIRELRRRVADLNDPIRYLIVADLAPRFALYYNVSDDVYAMNDPSHATLFKRREAALAVKRLLGGRLRVVRCTTRRRNGLRVPVRPTGPEPRKRRAKR